MPTFEDVPDTERPADGAGKTKANVGEGVAATSASGITRELVEETVPFLRDPRPEIRQAAAATAVAASATKEGVALLHECGAVKWLCRISGDVGTIGKDAVSCLVNVSAEETSMAALEDMCKAGIVNRMMEAVSSEECLPSTRDLCLQLLANVTRVQVGATKLAQVGVAGGALREGEYIRRLARWLANNPAEGGLPYPELVGGSRDDARVVDRRAALRDSHGGSDDDEKGSGAGGDVTAGRAGGGGGAKVLDQWQHCASVLCNAARIPEGRRALRRPDPVVALTSLLPQLASANPVRRWGIAGCVRNCCFEELDHPWLLHEVKVVPHLLMRLADDGDEYDFDEKVILDPCVWRKDDGSDAAPKRREPLQCIKRDIVEALLQLCAILESRQSLRKCGVYFVIREMDKSEPDAEISQVCYNLVNFLQRDEQDKQSRIDYLKGLAEGEGKQEAGAKEEDATAPASEMEIIPPPTAAPGSAADRQAYLEGKLAGENCGGPVVAKKVSKNALEGDGDEATEATEEFVGEEGGDAMIEMLSAFDDDSGDE
eukprot:g12231.t1